MPQRFVQGSDKIIKLISVSGAVLAYLGLVPKEIGLLPSLNIFNAVLVSVALFFLWTLHKDLDSLNNIDSSDGSPDMKDSDDLQARTDGGIWLSPELRELQEESPEGGGALAGLVAGGSLGMVGGPVGVVLGGIAGGLLGNEAEYQQIVSKYQDALAEAAKGALEREAKARAVRPYSIEDLNYRSGDGTYVVTITDMNKNNHKIILDLDKELYEYES